MFFVIRRATVLIPSGPVHDPDRMHLFVCMTNPIGFEQSTLWVPVNSVRAGAFVDPACLIDVGDHPFIRAESFIHYQFARIEVRAVS